MIPLTDRAQGPVPIEGVPSGAPFAGGGIFAFFIKVPGVLLALTLGRLALVPVIILSFDGVPAITAAALAAFIAVDLFDGVLARWVGADDPPRRALDSIVDRLSIWPVYGAVTLAGFLPPALFVALFARDLYCAYWCYRIVGDRDVAIRADWMYRALNLMLAAWIVLAPFASARLRDVLFVGVLVFSVVVAVDLKRSAVLVLQMPNHVRGVVISAGVLRRRRPAGRTPDELAVHARVTASAG